MEVWHHILNEEDKDLPWMCIIQDILKPVHLEMWKSAVWVQLINFTKSYPWLVDVEDASLKLCHLSLELQRKGICL